MVGAGGIDGAGRVDNVVVSLEFLFSGGFIESFLFKPASDFFLFELPPETLEDL